MSRQKLFYSIFLFAFYSVLLQAQTTTIISGQITDDAKPVEFCNVLIQSTTDTTYVKGAVSGTDGRFSINAKDGNYKLKVSLLGYGAVEKTITVKGNTDLGELVIKPSEEQLDEVVVQANLVDALADRYVMNNLGKQPIATGKSTLEILRYAPGVWVSQNGAISINGQGGTKVYINGRLLRYNADQLAAYLESIGAENIQKMEIIPDPTAEYDADSSGGVLSITVNRSAIEGISGSIYFRYRQDRYPSFMPNISLGYNRKKWSLTARYNFSYTSNLFKMEEQQEFPLERTKNHIQSQNLLKGGKFHIAEMEFTYNINKKQDLGIVVSGNFQNSGADTQSSRQIAGPTGNQLVKGVGGNIMNSKDVQASINYIYRIKPGNELKIKSDAYLSHNTMDFYSYSKYYREQNGIWENDPYYRSDFLQRTPHNSDIYSASADYKHTFKDKSHITFGGKFTYLSASNDTSLDRFTENTVLTDDFDYNENITALYVKYDMGGEKWAYTFSARAEYYGTNAISNTLSETYRQRFVGLFPFVNIRYYIDKDKGTSFGFNIGRSIKRQNFRDLNPNIIQTSDFVTRYGNAYLKPSYVNNAGLSATIKYQYVFSLDYSLTDNLYGVVTIADQNKENATISIPEKIKFHHQLNLNAYIPVSVTKWWNVMASLSGGYTWYNLLGETYDGVSGDIYLSSSFELPKSWGIELSWMAYTGGVSGNMKMGGAQMAALSINKRLFKSKNGTLAFGISDLFNSGNGGRQYFTSPDYYSSLKTFRDSRSFHIGFRYNFNHGLRKTGRYIERDSENKSRVM